MCELHLLSNKRGSFEKKKVFFVKSLHKMVTPPLSVPLL